MPLNPRLDQTSECPCCREPMLTGTRGAGYADPLGPAWYCARCDQVFTEPTPTTWSGYRCRRHSGKRRHEIDRGRTDA